MTWKRLLWEAGPALIIAGHGTYFIAIGDNTDGWIIVALALILLELVGWRVERHTRPEPTVTVVHKNGEVTRW